MKARSSTFRRLSVIAVTTLIISTSIVVTMNIRIQYQQEVQIQDQGLDRIESNIVPVISYLVWVVNNEQTFQIGQSLSEISGITSVTIQNEQGETIYTSGHASEYDGATESPRLVQWELSYLHGEEQYELGVLELSLVNPWRLVFARPAFRTLLLIEVLVMLAPLLFLFAAFRSMLSRPLRRLSHDIGEVDLAQPLPDWWETAEADETSAETYGIRAVISSASVRIQQEIQRRAQAEAELQTTLSEKLILLQEVHHRVKNNLQLMTSLIALQRQTMTDENARQALQDSENRITSMAVVHELLYREQQYTAVNLSQYLLDLSRSTVLPKLRNGHDISLLHDLSNINVALDIAIPLGLITNELLSNAAKHAFVGADSGTVTIATRETHDGLVLMVEDNGRGLPALFDKQRSQGLGMPIVESLCTQLHARFEHANREPGTIFSITVTLNPSG